MVHTYIPYVLFACHIPFKWYILYMKNLLNTYKFLSRNQGAIKNTIVGHMSVRLNIENLFCVPYFKKVIMQKIH